MWTKGFESLKSIQFNLDTPSQVSIILHLLNIYKYRDKYHKLKKFFSLKKIDSINFNDFVPSFAKTW